MPGSHQSGWETSKHALVSTLSLDRATTIVFINSVYSIEFFAPFNLNEFVYAD